MLSLIVFVITAFKECFNSDVTVFPFLCHFLDWLNYLIPLEQKKGISKNNKTIIKIMFFLDMCCRAYLKGIQCSIFLPMKHQHINFAKSLHSHKSTAKQIGRLRVACWGTTRLRVGSKCPQVLNGNKQGWKFLTVSGGWKRWMRKMWNMLPPSARTEKC